MAKKNYLPGWQTMESAAQRGRVTRQRIHQVLVENPDIETLRIFSRRLVPDPFPHEFEKKVSKR